jgi:hypothetical protein
VCLKEPTRSHVNVCLRWSVLILFLLLLYQFESIFRTKSYRRQNYKIVSKWFIGDGLAVKLLTKSYTML